MRATKLRKRMEMHLLVSGPLLRGVVRREAERKAMLRRSLKRRSDRPLADSTMLECKPARASLHHRKGTRAPSCGSGSMISAEPVGTPTLTCMTVTTVRAIGLFASAAGVMGTQPSTAASRMMRRVLPEKATLKKPPKARLLCVRLHLNAPVSTTV